MEELEKLMMELSKNKFNLQRFLTPRDRVPGIHWIGGWIGPRIRLGFVEKRNILPLP
jgi:hypothetical protein